MTITRRTLQAGTVVQIYGVHVRLVNDVLAETCEKNWQSIEDSRNEPCEVFTRIPEPQRTDAVNDLNGD